MTQQVRNGYRKHRRLALAATLVVLAAAALVVVVPALGSSPGEQILPQSNLGVTPTDVNVGGSNFSCTTNPTSGALSPAGLRTFQISAPPNSNAMATYDSTNTATSTTPLPAGVTFSVTGVNGQYKGQKFSFSASGAGGVNVSVYHVGVNGGSDTAWYDYYDNYLHAGITADGNLHATTKSSGDLYNASITTFCYALTTTISGRVYYDRDSSGTYTTGGPAGDLPKAWTVNLYQKVNGSYPSTPFMTTTSSSDDGTYTFTGVPTGSDYKVCTVASTADDSSAWGLRSPTGNSACGALSSSSVATSAGNLISNLSSPATGQDFSVAPVTTFGPGSDVTDGGYEVTGTGTKADQLYALDTWTDATTGNVYFSFSPLTSGSPCTSTSTSCLYLLETLTGDVPESTLNAAGGSIQVQLKYDDTAPYTDLQPMPYCKNDPRNTDGTLGTPDPSTILPSGATSCIVTGEQYVNPGSSPATVHFKYRVYTAFDGLRGT